jgi:hypothetical protein
MRLKGYERERRDAIAANEKSNPGGGTSGFSLTQEFYHGGSMIARLLPISATRATLCWMQRRCGTAQGASSTPLVAFESAV